MLKYKPLEPYAKRIAEFLIGKAKDEPSHNIMVIPEDDDRRLFIGLSLLTYHSKIYPDRKPIPNIWIISCSYYWYGGWTNDYYTELVEAPNGEYIPSLLRYDTEQMEYYEPSVRIDEKGKIFIPEPKKQESHATIISSFLLRSERVFNILFKINMGTFAPSV